MPRTVEEQALNEFYHVLDFHWSHDAGSQPDAVDSSDGEGGEGGEGGERVAHDDYVDPPCHVEPSEESAGEEIPATQPDNIEEDLDKATTSPEMPPPPVPVKSLPLPPSSAPSDLDQSSRDSAMMRVTALKSLSMLEKNCFRCFLISPNKWHP